MFGVKYLKSISNKELIYFSLGTIIIAYPFFGLLYHGDAPNKDSFSLTMVSSDFAAIGWLWMALCSISIVCSLAVLFNLPRRYQQLSHKYSRLGIISANSLLAASLFLFAMFTLHANRFITEDYMEYGRDRLFEENVSEFCLQLLAVGSVVALLSFGICAIVFLFMKSKPLTDKASGHGASSPRSGD